MVLNTEVREILNCVYSFHISVYHIVCLLVKLSVEAHMGSNTLVLQSYLHKFDAVLYLYLYLFCICVVTSCNNVRKE